MAFVLAIASAPEAPAAAPQPAKAKTKKCKTPGSLASAPTRGVFDAEGKKFKAKRTACGPAGKVVKAFPKYCAEAYAAQGTCKVKVGSKRWKCKSKLVGDLDRNAPAREKCKRKKSKLDFTVSMALPGEPVDLQPQPDPPAARQTTGATLRRAGSPYKDPPGCVDTTTASTLIPSPGSPFEVRLTPGVSTGTGNAIKNGLVGKDVVGKLMGGLGSTPRSDSPDGFPPTKIFVTKGDFDADGDLGVADDTCANNKIDGVVMTSTPPTNGIAATAAHELFHIYSYWGIAKKARYNGGVPWYEEAAATWFEGKAGFAEPTDYDRNLQFPNHPIDDTAHSYAYSMSRFIQFLDTKGFGLSGSTWPLHRAVISKYSAGATKTLDAQLRAQNSSLGEQAAAFWGDRLNAKPAHGPQLKPVSANSNTITIENGTTELPIPAKPLHTRLFDFKLKNEVQRVEFEFETPGGSGGYFWGLTDPDVPSQRFLNEDSVTFCVGGPGPTDELEWMKHFPITFTNGNLTGGDSVGTVTIRAQGDKELCKTTSGNRACRVLLNSGGPAFTGGGSILFSGQSNDEEFDYSTCAFGKDGSQVRLDVIRFKKRTAKEVRRGVKRQIQALGLTKVNAGDIAGVGIQDGDPPIAIGDMAVGKEIAFIEAFPASTGGVTRLLRNIAGQL